MATPNALLSYNLNILSCVQTVVTDEADFMVTSGGKDIWMILNFFNERKREVKKVRKKIIQTRSTNDIPRITERQFIFAAATLPSRGRKAASNVLRDWLPDAEFITTDSVHNTVPTVKMHYIEVEQCTKLPQLLMTLNIVAGEKMRYTYMVLVVVFLYRLQVQNCGTIGTRSTIHVLVFKK